jgi:hypothetical protein
MATARRVSLVFIVALSVLGGLSSSGSAQEGPESAVPPLPQPLEDKLPDPRQRHPWMPNDGGFLLNAAYVNGSWKNANGSITTFWCVVAVAADHPNWEQEDLLLTRYAGGVSCTVEMESMSGWGRAVSAPSGAELARAGLGSQHLAPSGDSWQARAVGTFTRSSLNASQQVHTKIVLTLPPRTAAQWGYAEGCVRLSTRTIDCELWSPPFQSVVHPCPSTKVGLQPLPGCVTGPQACPVGHIGLQPNCNPAPQPCPTGQLGLQPNCQPGFAPPSNTAVPTIGGTPKRGNSLTANPGEWAGNPRPTTGVQWLRCAPGCREIDGAVGDRYRIRLDDVGTRLAVRVTAINAFGLATASSAQTAVVVDDPETDPCPIGDPAGGPPHCDDAGEPCRSITEDRAGVTDADGGALDDIYLDTVGDNYPNDSMSDFEEATTVENEPSDDDETGGEPSPAASHHVQGCGSAVARAAGSMNPNSAERSYCITEPTVMPAPAGRKRTEDCLEAFDAADRALKMAKERFGKLAADGKMGNAFQHCAWNGRMVQRLDSMKKAKKFADLHEADSKHDKLYQMDIWNNEEGRREGDAQPSARGVYTVCTKAARGTPPPTLLIAKGKGKNMAD